MQTTMTLKTVKLRCLKCGAEHFVTPTKPGLHLFVCQHCGAQHAMTLDTNLELRDFRLIDQVDAMPAGLYEITDVDVLPARLKEIFMKLGSVNDERLREAVELAKKLGLFKVIG